MGVLVYTALVVAMTAREAMIAMDISWFIVVCFIALSALFLGAVSGIDIMGPTGIPLLFQQQTASILWDRVILTAFTVVIMEYALLGIPRITFPSFMQLIRERSRLQIAPSDTVLVDDNVSV